MRAALLDRPVPETRHIPLLLDLYRTILMPAERPIAAIAFIEQHDTHWPSIAIEDPSNKGTDTLYGAASGNRAGRQAHAGLGISHRPKPVGKFGQLMRIEQPSAQFEAIMLQRGCHPSGRSSDEEGSLNHFGPVLVIWKQSSSLTPNLPGR